MLFAQGDPTGLAGPLGQAVIAAGLIVVIILAIRFLWERRNRR
ncbi:hypothetical protein [Saccharopolyspora taberi]|uniref:Uncharacterized protein n=1 Tax=Saccharopolyspora taberi TaxID=60895 RepID=A0ABN3VFI1_9PSEU